MLQEYDNYSHNYDFYVDLAWEGLNYPDFDIWNEKSRTEKTNIINTINNYIYANKNEGCQE